MNTRIRTLSPLVLAAALLTACVDDSQTAALEPEADAVTADVTTPDSSADATPTDAGPTADADAPPPDAAPPPPPPEACADEDDLAPNDVTERAAPIETGFTRDNLFLCAGSADWFRLTLSAQERVLVQLAANPADRDLDLLLLSEAGEVVATSATESGEERLAYTAEAAGTYFVQVIGGFRDVEVQYALSVTSQCRLDSQCGSNQACSAFTGECVDLPPPERACGADAFEPNDTDANAAMLDADGPPIDAVACALSPDWYVLPAEAGDTWDVLLTFAQGEDLDFVVRDLSTGALVASATGDANSNPERARISHLSAGRYALGVLLADGGRNGRRELPYRLDVARTAGRCEADRDCAGLGRPLCDVASGVCVPVPDAGQVQLGDTCGTTEDCADAEATCYQGRAGGQDNLCTVTCQDDAQCDVLARNAYCQFSGRRGGVCLYPCETDLDCASDFRECVAGRCEIRQQCRSSADCPDGDVCAQTPFGAFLCSAPPPPATCGDDGQPNDTPATATALETRGMSVGGLACQGDRDWFVVDVPADRAGGTLRVQVSFRAGVDIDAYAAVVSGAEGVLIGAATSPDMTTETIELRFVPAGSIYFRVEQFSSDALADTPYTISAELVDAPSGCTAEGNECLGLEFPRITCDAATGACLPLRGDGQVALGGLCDSDDDCGAGAEACWTFEGAEGVRAGANICTHTCQAEADCADVPNTTCIAFQQGQFAVCLPPR
jgi:hypothetical protein